MNRVRHSGIQHPTPYFNEAEGLKRKAKIDRYLDKKMEEWRQTIPYASHMKDKNINMAYYRRTLIEHIWRIRLSRVSQSKAIYKIAQISPSAAQDYAHYQADEMLHDKLYIHDCEAAGVTMEEVLKTEPYLSTRLFEGFSTTRWNTSIPWRRWCRTTWSNTPRPSCSLTSSRTCAARLAMTWSRGRKPI
ncbi:hypothetical protein WJ978_07900 [Achromobacter xylosoxidans]